MATNPPTRPVSNAPRPVTTPAPTSVDQTILIVILVIAGILFLALLGWSIWSTQRGSHVLENGEKEHHHHRKSSGMRRRTKKDNVKVYA